MKLPIISDCIASGKYELPTALNVLETYPQFIICRFKPRDGNPDKMDKIPIDWRTTRATSALDTKIWLPAREAILTASALGENYGIGFVFTHNDPFWFLDIDNCLEPCGTKWSSLANELVTMFDGAAIEVSSSGKGLHIFGSGTASDHKSRDSQGLGLEFYTEKHFVALTGDHIKGDIEKDFTDKLPLLVKDYFSVSIKEKENNEWTTEPCEDWSGFKNDEELIRHACEAQSAHSIFKNKATFHDLWNANGDALSKSYPSSSHSCGYDESAADMALACHLAFWTGKDCERIKHLMLQSELNRDKWNREDYLNRTILNACKQVDKFFIQKINNNINSTKPEPLPTLPHVMVSLP